jgi:hypothetical protein
MRMKSDRLSGLSGDRTQEAVDEGRSPGRHVFFPLDPRDGRHAGLRRRRGRRVAGDAGLYEKLLREAFASGKGHALVCQGLGIGTVHNQNTPEGMIEEMRISRALKADGVVHFSSAGLREPFLDKLKKAR